jgi:hypothetical protein
MLHLLVLKYVDAVEIESMCFFALPLFLLALIKVQNWILRTQTGDAACRDRAKYVVDELARAQKARGTEYVGAPGRKRKIGTIVDGEEIFGEVKKGEITLAALTSIGRGLRCTPCINSLRDCLT